MAVPPTASATRRAGSSRFSNDGCIVTVSSAEVGETFRAAAAPRFALRGLPLVGDVARKHDRADDAIAVVADRRRFQIDDAIVAAARRRERGSRT